MKAYRLLNPVEQLLAYDPERNQIVEVLSIVTSKHGEREQGKTELFNGHITYWKNHLKGDCVLLPYTGQGDKDKTSIHLGDLLRNDEMIFVVEWNRNQAGFWLSPVKSLKELEFKNEFDLILHMGNQNLGDGYFNRKDLTKIGNIYTDKAKFEIED